MIITVWGGALWWLQIPLLHARSDNGRRLHGAVAKTAVRIRLCIPFDTLDNINWRSKAMNKKNTFSGLRDFLVLICFRDRKGFWYSGNLLHCWCNRVYYEHRCFKEAFVSKLEWWESMIDFLSLRMWILKIQFVLYRRLQVWTLLERMLRKELKIYMHKSSL